MATLGPIGLVKGSRFRVWGLQFYPQGSPKMAPPIVTCFPKEGMGSFGRAPCFDSFSVVYVHVVELQACCVDLIKRIATLIA